MKQVMDKVGAPIFKAILRAVANRRKALVMTSLTDLEDDERAFLDGLGIRYLEHREGGFSVIFTEIDPKEPKYAHLNFLTASGRGVADRVIHTFFRRDGSSRRRLKALPFGAAPAKPTHMTPARSRQ